MNRALEDLVRARAADRCEYCHLVQSQHPWRFEIDHIIAEQHGGTAEPNNLAMCCPKCNRHKGPNISGIDPDTAAVVALFHPRKQIWTEHFKWNGPLLIGLTPIGRATINTLKMNDPVRIALRQALIDEGVFES